MKLYIFGVGKGKGIVRKCLKKGITVDKYVDNNEELVGKEVDGIAVVGIKEIEASVDYIIISVMAYKRIYDQLVNMNIDAKKILPFFSAKVFMDNSFRRLVNCTKWARNMLLYYARKLKKFLWNITPSRRAHLKAFQRFLEDQGDTVLRFDYDLNQNSTVFDLGGYKGDFTQSIVDKYDCYVWTFEPVPEYAEKIRERFKENSKVKVFSFGLEDRDSQEILYMHNDGSSVYKNKNSSKEVIIRYQCISKFLKDNKITNINLMKVNIEGGEYSLMEHMIKTGEIRMVENLQIQFHDIKKLNARKRQNKICEMLEKTHELTWAYRPFVFDSWKRKKI